MQVLPSIRSGQQTLLFFVLSTTGSTSQAVASVLINTVNIFGVTLLGGSVDPIFVVGEDAPLVASLSLCSSISVA